MPKLKDIARIVRSKNAGPYHCTFDIFFTKEEDYLRIKKENTINKEVIKKLYKIKDEDILGIYYYDPVNAVKVTIMRKIPSGNIGDGDVMAAQQNAPLLELEV